MADTTALPPLPGLPLPAMHTADHVELHTALACRQYAVRYGHACANAAGVPSLPGGWRCTADDTHAHLVRDGLHVTLRRDSADVIERGAAEFVADLAAAQQPAESVAVQQRVMQLLEPVIAAAWRCSNVETEAAKGVFAREVLALAGFAPVDSASSQQQGQVLKGQPEAVLRQVLRALEHARDYIGTDEPQPAALCDVLAAIGALEQQV